MKTVFLTGISGLLGTNLAHQLLAAGYKVIGLVRKKESYHGLNHPNLILLEGNLFSDFSEVLQEVDIVIHAAAETRQSLSKYSHYYQINCNATIFLYNTSVHCKVAHFIYISTANTSGYGTKEFPGTENTAVKSPFDQSLYAKSKLEAENYLIDSTHRIKVTILNPTFMIGAWDSKPSSGKIIKMGWKKRVTFYPPGGKNFVHVEDVANAAIQCIDSETTVEKYIISGENLSFKEFFTKVVSIAQQNTLLIPLPRPVMLFVGYIGECMRLIGIETDLCINNMKILCINNFYSNEKSVHHLGLSYRPVDQSISDAIDYFKKTKLI